MWCPRRQEALIPLRHKLRGRTLSVSKTLALYNKKVIIESVPWKVEYTDQFEDWFAALPEAVQNAIVAAVEIVQEQGPGLGRPLVDTIKASRHANMKELRPLFGNVRILFAFDPRRMAILLIGGDKTNRWKAWYRAFVPIADRLYDEHLEILKQEGLLS